MKFGHFCLPTYYADVYPDVGTHMRHLIDFMASSEDLGFDAVWANEHHFHPYGGHIPCVPVFLAALAERTKRVRLGTSIISLALHNPIEVAEQMAMVDLISGGRVDFGIGRGFVIHDHESFNIPIEDAQGRTTEGLEVILKAWTGERFSHHGQHFNYENLTVWPKPAQSPVPVWEACSGTPSSFERTAKHGHKLLTVAYLKPLEKLGELTQMYRDVWVDSGHDLAKAEIGTHYQVILDDDRDRARRRAKEALTRYSSLLRESIKLAKNVNEALLHSSQEEVDIDQIVDQGRMIAGTPEDALATLRRAEDELGVTIVDCNFLFGGLTYEEADRTINMFSTEVIPKMRDSHPSWQGQLAAAR